MLSKTIWYKIPSFLESTLRILVILASFSVWSYPTNVSTFPGIKTDQSSVETSEAARERAFCFCNSVSKPASSKLNPLSLRIKAVKSIGNPKVSYNSNAFSPETSFPEVFYITFSNN